MSGRNPRPGDLYRHFKGKPYQIIAIAQDAEDDSKKVVYQALYGDFKIYVRDYDAFISEVDREKYPEAEERFRFESVEAVSENEDAQEERAEEAAGVPKTEAVEMQEIVNPEEQVNPDLLAFLEARANDEKIEILYQIRNNIDESVMSAIEASLDLCNVEGSLEDRIMFVRNNLATRAKYEGSRLR